MVIQVFSCSNLDSRVNSCREIFLRILYLPNFKKKIIKILEKGTDCTYIIPLFSMPDIELIFHFASQHLNSSNDENKFSGEIFEKLEDEDEQGWCKGRKDGRVGLYPANYADAVAQ